MILNLAGKITTAEDPNLPGACLCLARDIAAFSKELERLKPLVRELARKQNPENNRVVIPALSPYPEDQSLPLGEVTVSFQKNRVVLNSDPELLKAALGGELFDMLFETKISYRPREDILSQVNNLPPNLSEQVRGALLSCEETPRVGFPNK